MMSFELGLKVINPKCTRNSDLTIAGAYIDCGLIPHFPYMRLNDAAVALLLSVGMTLAALFVFGCFKGHFTDAPPLLSALQTSLIGWLAARPP